ncbi:MAG: tetratricopeptide repeat protein [Armatimonadota bacterium]
MQCDGCGYQNPEGAQWCAQCRRPLPAAQAPVVVPPSYTQPPGAAPAQQPYPGYPTAQQRPTVSRTAILVAVLSGMVLLVGAGFIAYQFSGPIRGGLELQKAHRLQLQGKTAEALAAFERAVELSPRDPQAWVGLGIAAYDGGDLKRSIEAYRKALKLDETLAIAHNNMAYVLYDEEKVDEAVDEWEKAIEDLPKSQTDEQGRADCWAGLAIGYLAQGKRDKAVRTYGHAVSINPHYLNTEWMAEVAFWSPKAIEAAEELIPAVREQPSPVPDGTLPTA